MIKEYTKEELEELSVQELEELLEQEEGLSSTKNNQQQAMKISLNSLFGALSNSMFILFNKAIGRSITSGGRLFDRWCSKNLDKELTKRYDYSNKVPSIQLDTDSCYIQVHPVVKKHLPNETNQWKIVDFLANKFEPILDKINNNTISTISNIFNIRRKEVLIFEREVIASSSVNVGKKNYAMVVLDNEGIRYPHGKKKIVGLAIKKTNLPEFVRHKLLDFLEIILNGKENNFQKEFKKFRTEFNSKKADDIAFPRGCNIRSATSGRLYTLEQKGVPIHVKGALRYNKFIKTLDKKYIKIEDGNKIKFLYIKEPNIIQDKVIGYPNSKDYQDFIENEGLDKFIDYNLMFQKDVIQPLEPLIKCKKWDFEKKNKLF